VTSAKLPREPPNDLDQRLPDWVVWSVEHPLWHVVNTAGPYAAAFGAMRSYGPLRSARFDPHPLPVSDHPTERVLYAAADMVTALAERFQRNREIRCHQPEAPGVYSWSPTRELRLIDLSGTGALRLGASHVLSTGPKRATRAWARALHRSWPEADGLLYVSSMAGRTCVALWAPALDSFPAAPAFAKLLSDPAPGWQARLRSSAVHIGYDYFT